MKILHGLFGFVLFIGLLLAGGAVVFAAWDVELWNQGLSVLASERVVAMWGAIALILWVFIYLMTGCCRRTKAGFISFENEGGAVSISMQAVCNFLSKIGSEFAAILELRPSIRAVSGALDVTLDVKVKSGTQIPELCRMVQERVKESITNNLGLSEIKGIRVNVQEIVASESKPRSESAPSQGPQ